MILRRTLLAGASLAPLRGIVLAGRLPMRGGFSGNPSAAFLPTSYMFSNHFKYNSQYPTKYNTGDGYNPTWADDGNLYIGSNDTFGGFQGDASGANASLAKLDGYTSALTGSTVNNNLIFGTTSQIGPNGWNWKSQGPLSIGSTLYFMMSGTGTSGSPTVQSQLLKSTDHGVTLAPLPGSGVIPYSTGMFNNGPYFGGWVQYGQAYMGNGPHNSGTYVYALTRAASGGQLGAQIGRVSLANIGNQNGADWTWYTGGDGMLNANWSSTYSSAVLALAYTPAGSPGSNPYTWPNVQYLPFFGCYVAVPTYWTGGSSGSPKMPVLVSLTPWGPYTLVGSEFDPVAAGFGALFDTTVAPSSVAVDGGRTTVLISSGDFTQTNPATGGIYCINLLTMSLA